MPDEMPKTEEEWKETLTDEQFRVLRKKGTEPAFSGVLLENKASGMYVCAGCGAELFSSDTKFDSGTGWPSFFEPAKEESVVTEVDNTFGMERLEVKCAKCGGHLGHVFPDGPKDRTGKRFCINSCSLEFKTE